MNAALLHEQATGPLRFVTACCLVLEPDGARGCRVRVSVAGHPLPLLRAPGGEVAEVGTCHRPLGIDPDVSFEEAVVDLPRGSTLLLYTDGVTEARDTSGAQFGEEGLVRILAGLTTPSAEAAIEAVSATVEARLHGSPYEADDLAVLALTVPA